MGTGLFFAFGIYGLLVPATIILLLGVSYRVYLGTCSSPAEEETGGPSTGSSYSALSHEDQGSAKLIDDGEENGSRVTKIN